MHPWDETASFMVGDTEKKVLLVRPSIEAITYAARLERTSWG